MSEWGDYDFKHATVNDPDVRIYFLGNFYNVIKCQTNPLNK